MQRKISDKLEKKIASYSVLFIGAGFLGRHISSFMVNGGYFGAYPYLGEVILHKTHRDEEYRNFVQELGGKGQEVGIRVRELEHYAQQAGAGNIDLTEPSVVDFVLNPRRKRGLARPDVTVVAVRHPEVRKQRESGQLRDRNARAAFNLEIIKNYARQFKGYGGVVMLMTNPVDLCAQVFCAESGMDPRKVVGSQELDSSTLRRYLYKEGKIHDDGDYIGLGLENVFPAPRDVDGHENRLAKRLHNFLPAFSSGFHNRYDVAPIVSLLDATLQTHITERLKQQDIHAPILAQLTQEVDDVEPNERAAKEAQLQEYETIMKGLESGDPGAVVDAIAVHVGLLRRYYTEQGKPSYDTVPSAAETIDLIGSVSATREPYVQPTIETNPHHGHSAFNGTFPTGSIPYDHDGTIVFTGQPMAVNFDVRLGVLLEPAKKVLERRSNIEKQRLDFVVTREIASRKARGIGPTTRLHNGHRVSVEILPERYLNTFDEDMQRVPEEDSDEPPNLLVVEGVNKDKLSQYDTETGMQKLIEDKKTVKILSLAVHQVRDRTYVTRAFTQNIGGHIRHYVELEANGINLVKIPVERKVSYTVALDDMLVAVHEHSISVINVSGEPVEWCEEGPVPVQLNMISGRGTNLYGVKQDDQKSLMKLTKHTGDSATFNLDTKDRIKKTDSAITSYGIAHDGTAYIGDEEGRLYIVNNNTTGGIDKKISLQRGSKKTGKIENLQVYEQNGSTQVVFSIGNTVYHLQDPELRPEKVRVDLSDLDYLAQQSFDKEVTHVTYDPNNRTVYVGIDKTTRKKGTDVVNKWTEIHKWDPSQPAQDTTKPLAQTDWHCTHLILTR